MGNNIRDRDKVAERLWDWGFLNVCFTRGIRPCDIDGTVERNGHFLFLEGKGPGGSFTTGQSLYFRQLVEMGKAAAPSHSVTFVLLSGNPETGKVDSMLSNSSVDRFKHPRHQADIGDVIDFVEAWYKWANDES